MRLGLRWQLLTAMVGLVAAAVVFITMVTLQLSQRAMTAQSVRAASQLVTVVLATSQRPLDAAQALGADGAVRCVDGQAVGTWGIVPEGHPCSELESGAWYDGDGVARVVLADSGDGASGDPAGHTVVWMPLAEESAFVSASRGAIVLYVGLIASLVLRIWLRAADATLGSPDLAS